MMRARPHHRHGRSSALSARDYEMNHIFLSYTNKTEDLAQNLEAVLIGLGGNVFNYKHPTEQTAINADVLQRLRKECSAAHFFVQLIEGHLGTVEIDSTSLIRQEFDWFMQSRARWDNTRPRPVVIKLDVKTDAPAESHLRYAAEQGAEVIICENKRNALQVVTGWYSKQRVRAQEPTAIPGHMDLEVAEPFVDSALSAAIHTEQLIPQKLLYTSPFGALFWRRLARSPQSSVRKMYDIVDFSSDQTDVVSLCIKQVTATWDPRLPLSVIALGCGDGRREAMFAEALTRALPNRELRVLLVDISKTLVATAAREFVLFANRKNIDMKLAFALADFEHPATMALLMRQWSPDLPVIILFLGNTLGNINISSFMDALSSSMKREDLLLSEVTLTATDKLPPFNRGPKQNVSPQHEDRFDFLTGPIRQLGLLPKLKNFKVQVDEESLCARRTYSYDFDEAEFQAVQSILGTENRKGRILLLRVDSFRQQALLDELSPSFNINGARIYVHTGIVGRNGEPGRMGVFLARRGEPLR